MLLVELHLLLWLCQQALVVGVSLGLWLRLGHDNLLPIRVRGRHPKLPHSLGLVKDGR